MPWLATGREPAGATGLSLCPDQEPGYLGGDQFNNTTTAQVGAAAPITVQAGRTYALLVDNYSVSNSGFQLTFGGACPDTLLPNTLRPVHLGFNARFSATGQLTRTVTLTPVTQASVTPIGYFWNLGDGYTSTDALPTHTYSADGLYTATLTITDVLGSRATYSQVLRIGQVNGLAADLAVRTALVLAPNPAHGTVRLILGEGMSGKTAVVADAMGREVRIVALNANQRAADINLHDLRPGVYTVRVDAVARRLVVE